MMMACIRESVHAGYRAASTGWDQHYHHHHRHCRRRHQPAANCAKTARSRGLSSRDQTAIIIGAESLRCRARLSQI